MLINEFRGNLMHRKWFVFLLIQFLLVACGGSTQPEGFRQVGDVTDTAFTSPTTTLTDTPTLTPSNTPTPTYTQTPTLTPTLTPTQKPTITPTPTITPENFVLAESGYDIANVRVSYPREDTMFVDFDYRLSDDIERAMITMQLPADCRDDWVFVFDAPNTDVFDPVGSSSIRYKLPLEGTCEHESFYLNIHPMTM